jgi:hypothetical protein
MKGAIGKIRYEGVDWIKLAQDRFQWYAFVNADDDCWFHTSGEFFDQ